METATRMCNKAITSKTMAGGFITSKTMAGGDVSWDDYREYYWDTDAREDVHLGASEPDGRRRAPKAVRGVDVGVKKRDLLKAWAFDKKRRERKRNVGRTSKDAQLVEPTRAYREQISDMQWANSMGRYRFVGALAPEDKDGLGAIEMTMSLEAKRVRLEEHVKCLRYMVTMSAGNLWKKGWVSRAEKTCVDRDDRDSYHGANPRFLQSHKRAQIAGKDGYWSLQTRETTKNRRLDSTIHFWGTLQRRLEDLAQINRYMMLSREARAREDTANMRLSIERDKNMELEEEIERLRSMLLKANRR